MRSAISLIFAFLLTGAHAQESFTREQALADFEVFKQSLLEMHPALYTYFSADQINKFMERANSRLDREVSGHTLHRTLLECAASIRDGHTYLTYPKEWNTYMGMDRLLPMQFAIRDGRVYVVDDLSRSGDIPAGSELLSINGIDVVSLQKRLYTHTSCDGNVQEYKGAINARYFSKRLLYLFPAIDSYDVEFRTPTGNTGFCTLNGISEQELYSAVSNEDIHFAMDRDKGLAVLRIRSFTHNTTEQEGQGFYESLAEAFKQIRKKDVTELVIDLRGNAGGNNDLAVALYAYISRGAFSYLNEGTSAVDPLAPLAEHVDILPGVSFSYLSEDDSRISSNNTGSSTAQEVHDGVHITVLPENELIDISRNKFAGKVSVLTDPLTRSAASIFAGVCHANDRATIVGQGTGTACDSFCGGGTIKITLPNSGIILNMPIEQRSIANGKCGEFGREVRPDKEIRPTIDDLLNGRDIVLDAAMD